MRSKAETGISQPRGKARFAAGIFVAAISVSFLASSFFASSAHGNPSGGSVAAGSASIATSGNTLDIDQSTQRAVIDWRSFNIAPSETTKFNQPSSSSVTLNRINDPDPSQILGTLTANGNVILINPNGVFFGPGSQVDVNGLIATTANIKNSDFMAGNMNFGIPGNPNASIVNQGTITAKDAGMVGLVAPNVINSGTINTKLGHTDLGSGDTFTMDMYGDGLIEVGVSDAVKKQVIENTGTINAAGGTIQVTAAAGRKVVDSLVTISGKLNAPTAQQKNGRIIISAAGSNAVANNVAANKGVKTGSSTVLVSGTLDASGYASGQTGGSIEVLGDNVGILSGAKIDASGNTGGGNIEIGGDFHGKGTTPTALHTVVQNDTSIEANATTTGNGGNVAVWADDSTAFDGSIEAKGGANSGNGGYVETSGHQTLSLSGTVDASAPDGQAGTWLLDPNNVTITNTATTNTGSAPNFSDTGSPANVNTTDIVSALNLGTNVSVTASGSIAVNNSIAENTYNGTESLTLAAGTDITLANTVAITASGNSILNVTLDSNTGGAGGAIVMNSGSSITTNGGNIIMGGGATPLTSAAVGDTTTARFGVTLAYSNIAAGGGNISMNGIGSSIAPGCGIYMGGSTVSTTGNGTITMSGISNGAGNYSAGIEIVTSIGSISSVNGNITLTGQGSTAGTVLSDDGIYLASGTIQTTGAGSIILNGTGGGTGASNVGIETDGTIRDTGTGNIILTGQGSPTGTTTGNYGLWIYGGSIAASGGNISITGTAGTGTNSNQGIQLEYGGNGISTTGTGTVTISGTGGGTGTDNFGILLDNSSTVISTVDGALSITGTGASGGSSSDDGVRVTAGAIKTTGLGNLSVTGVMGGGGTTYGVNVAPANGLQTTGSGNITVNTDAISLGAANALNAGSHNVTIVPYTASTPINVATGSTGLQITSGILGDVTAGGITIGSTSDTGGMNVGAYNWSAPLTLLSGSGSININGAQAMGANTLLADTISGNITLAASGGVTSSAAGTPITLAASGGNFTDSNASASALSATSGRWLVYSTNPASDNDGALVNSFRRFSCTYGGSCPSFPGTGNGFLYATTPVLTATPAALGITYGSAAPSLTGYGYTLSGYLGSDGPADTITGSVNGSTTYTPASSIGTYNINYASGALASALGYGFSYANNASAFTVNPAALTITANSFGKTYGTTYSFLGTEFTDTGLVNGNTVTGITLSSPGAAPTATVAGGPYSITGSDATGTGLSNYNISYVDGQLTVNPAALALTITADNVSKSYGTTYSFLGTEFTDSGLVNGDTVTGVSLTSPGAAAAATGGLYAITPGNATGTGLSNYTISYVDGLFIVVPVALPNTIAWTLPNASGAACNSLFGSCVMPEGAQDAFADGSNDNLDIRISPELAAMLSY